MEQREKAIFESVDSLGLSDTQKDRLKATIYDISMLTEKALLKARLLANSIPGYVEILTGDKEKGLELADEVKKFIMELALDAYGRTANQ